jgi:hypothetical protein
VNALLMGGQACILYGGAEFSRDVDFAIAVDDRSLERLRTALAELEAEPIYFPPLSSTALAAGHACHFRCLAPGLNQVRVDLMHRLRGADSFAELWLRRQLVNVPGVGTIHVMAIEDLVVVKKTQRDKDWPMVRRMIEADVARTRRRTAHKVRFWLRECRTPDLLVELAARHRAAAQRLLTQRPLLRRAIAGNEAAIARELRREEDAERARDREYWRPLRAELERMRHARKRPAR